MHGLIRMSTNRQQTKTLELFSRWSLFLLVEVIETLLTLNRESRDTLNIQRRKDIISHRNRSPYNHTTYGVVPLVATQLAWQPSGYHSISLLNRSEAKPSGVPYPLPVENDGPPRGESWPGRIDIRLQRFLSFSYGLYLPSSIS